MFHHLRRLWRPEGRSKPLPSRHCCGNDSSGPPSFGGVPRGPVLRLRRKTTRFHLVPALACVSCRYPNQSRSHPSLRWDRLNRVVLRLSARRAGRCPPQEKKKHSASLRLFFFFSCGSPQQVATCTAGFAPIDLFSTRFAQRGKKSTGPPAGRALHRGPLVERAPHPKCSPPALRFATASRGGSIWGGSPAQAPACAFVVFFKRQLYV